MQKTSGTQKLPTTTKDEGEKGSSTFFSPNVKSTDITWDINELRMMPGGTATVVLRHVSLVPPKVNGKNKLMFESMPSVSRWRYHSGKWKMFYKWAIA